MENMLPFHRVHRRLRWHRWGVKCLSRRNWLNRDKNCWNNVIKSCSRSRNNYKYDFWFTKCLLIIAIVQEHYTRLQQLSRGQIPRGILNDLKKTGSESNIVSKA